MDILNYLESLAIKWKTIGLKLGIPLAKLDSIESTETNLDNKLIRMINEWLKRVHDEEKWGQPTWKKLASVVEDIDKPRAQTIRKDHSSKARV